LGIHGVFDMIGASVLRVDVIHRRIEELSACAKGTDEDKDLKGIMRHSS
jgi:hypothetical protein